MKEFANRLKELRTSKGLTQEQLSKRLNVSKSRISMYETGDREPNFETLELIADYFNVDMNYLIGKSNTSNMYIYDFHRYSESESDLIEKFRSLNEDGQKALMQQAEVMSNMDIYKNSNECDNVSKEA